MASAIAICSCPRLGFMDFMGESLMAFAQNNVAYSNAFGAYWGQALSEAIRAAIDKGFDYIITTDYDSLFSSENVGTLIKLMDDNPEADAICSAQMGRFSGLLISTKSGTIDSKDLKTKDLVEIDRGAFGLTILRASSFTDLKKPWFTHTPDSNGDWASNSDKVYDDIYFWKNLAECGKKVFLAPRVVIGHLELLIKWPDENMNEMYETMKDYREHGAPADCWK